MSSPDIGHPRLAPSANECQTVPNSFIGLAVHSVGYALNQFGFPPLRVSSFLTTILICINLWCSVASADEPSGMSEAFGSTDEIEFFERKIRPLFAEHCYSCHSVNSESLQAGLLMDSRASLLAGGDSGEAIVPGDVDGSLLVEAVRYESYEMPPRGKLPAEGIQAIEQWIEMGAPWPKEDSPSAVGVAAKGLICSNAKPTIGSGNRFSRLRFPKSPMPHGHATHWIVLCWRS